MNGAEAVVRMLELHGVTHVFGLCGDTSLPLYDALYCGGGSITHSLTRDERSAADMADSYARATGKVGVCEGPSGGGATYIVPGLVEANESSIPILAITTDVGVGSRGRYTLTELDQRRLFAPVSKWNAVIDRAADIPRVFRAAFARPAAAQPRSRACGALYTHRPSASESPETMNRRVRKAVFPVGGLGTLGYAVPAAMGAKVGTPDLAVWAIDGDGCFQMTNQELATCAIEGIPVKVAIINNGSLGMVRQWQTLFYNERYSNTDLHVSPAGGSGGVVPPSQHAEPRKPAGTRIPDFVKLAEAYGCEGIRCEEPGDVDKVIEQAMAIDDRPVVLDFVVHKDAMVWPMVAAGTSNNDIKFARGLAPDWGGSDD